MKKDKLIIIFIIFAIIISIPFGWHYAVGPRFCTDGVSNERCLYYKFNVYHSIDYIDANDSPESHGITLKKQIPDDRISEKYYLGTDKHGDEVIVVDYIECLAVYKI